MKKVGLRIRELRKSHDMTLEQLARKLGFSSKSTTARIENGEYKLSYDILRNLADIFDVSMSYIIGDDDYVTMFSVSGRVTAGFGNNPILEYDDEQIEIPNSWLRNQPKKNFIVLKIKGDSMFPDFKEGDICLIHLQNVCDYSGQVAVCMYDSDKASIKQVRYD